MPVSPAEGGQSWVRVESEHFAIVTDFDRDDAESTARLLEEGFDAIAQIAFVHPRTRVEPTTVVIFRSPSDYHAFMPPLVAGIFASHWPNDRQLETALAVSPEDARFLLGLLRLRLARYRKSASIGTAPVLDAALRLLRVAHTSTELNAVADTLRGLSRPEQAIIPAERAVALSPFDPDVLDTLANVQFDLGRVQDAIDLQRAAISFLDEHTANKGYEERLSRYEDAQRAKP